MSLQPKTAGMLTAVAAFLRDVCVPALSDREAFLAKVAANMVDIAAREAITGPAMTALETTMLQRLLSMEEADLEVLRATLCDQITMGAWDETEPAFMNALLSIAAARVRIEQPGYASLRKAPAADPV